MTGYGIALLRKYVGLKPRELARLLGVNVTTVYRWEQHAETRPPLSETCRRMLILLRDATPSKQRGVVLDLRTLGWRAAWARLF